MYFIGNRRHVAAVRRWLPEEVEKGRIVLTVATIRFEYPNRDAVVALEEALDRMHPPWRENPMEHLWANTHGLRREYLLILKIRADLFRQLNIDPSKS